MVDATDSKSVSGDRVSVRVRPPAPCSGSGNVVLTVCIDLKSVSDKDNSTADVYISVNNVAFPEEGWSDFIVILSWWLRAMRSLREGSSDDAVLDFMDGPFNIYLQRTSGSRARFYLRENEVDLTLEELGILQPETEIEDVYADLRRVCAELVNEMQRVGKGNLASVRDIVAELR